MSQTVSLNHLMQFFLQNGLYQNSTILCKYIITINGSVKMGNIQYNQIKISFIKKGKLDSICDVSIRHND